MPYNLLLFPLIGGYYIVTTSYLFKYYHQRIDRQRLLFNSAFAGIILLIVSFAIAVLFETLLPGLAYLFKRTIPIEYLGTSFNSLLLGLAFVYVGNRILSDEDQIEKAIDRIGDELEVLMLDSLGQKSLIILTLKSDKVYVGWAYTLQKPGTKYLRLLPAFSGYRTAEKRIHFTTQYIDIYIEYQQKNELEQLDHAYFEILIAKEEVIVANRFDEEIYEMFSAHKPQTKSENQANKSSNN